MHTLALAMAKLGETTSSGRRRLGDTIWTTPSARSDHSGRAPRVEQDRQVTVTVLVTVVVLPQLSVATSLIV